MLVNDLVKSCIYVLLQFLEFSTYTLPTYTYIIAASIQRTRVPIFARSVTFAQVKIYNFRNSEQKSEPIKIT